MNSTQNSRIYCVIDLHACYFCPGQIGQETDLIEKEQTNLGNAVFPGVISRRAWNTPGGLANGLSRYLKAIGHPVEPTVFFADGVGYTDSALSLFY